MREILFKAKRVDNGEWVVGYYFKAEAHWHKHGIHEDWILTRAIQNGGWCNVFQKHAIDKETLCQYTGLTDKNGNKIWENDVVEIPSEDENFKLEWQDDTAQFVMSGDSFVVTFDNYWSHEVEVIGNIFDNPELLEGGEQ